MTFGNNASLVPALALLSRESERASSALHFCLGLVGKICADDVRVFRALIDVFAYSFHFYKFLLMHASGNFLL